MICNCGECVVCMAIDSNELDRGEMEESIKQKEKIRERHGDKNDA